MTIKLEDVFKVSGVPTHTFVRPSEFNKLMVYLRTPGRGVVIEGPSGIGKTTSVVKALQEINVHVKVLTARKEDHRAEIVELPKKTNFGTVIIDDFHRLDEKTQRSIADCLKTLADEGGTGSKLILIGINKVGDSLINFASDLNNRIDTLKFEKNPDEKVAELIQKGSEALNIVMPILEDVVKNAQGSFHITQLLCREACLLNSVTERSESKKTLEVSFEQVNETIWTELSRLFHQKAGKFATGPRLRREGRAPYLHILKWLADSEDWSLHIDEAMVKNPGQRQSVGVVVDSNYIGKFLSENSDLYEILHYNSHTHILSAEDPKFIYYLRSLSWNKFAKQLGFLGMDFKGRYDFALSFSGTDRDVAQKLYDKLTEHEISVFYDKNEASRIIAANIEDYLGPIYRSDAEFVIALLGKDYPTRIWTKFESDQFKSRFGEGRVVPVWFSDAPPSMFDESTKVGGLQLNMAANLDAQIDQLVGVLVKKIKELRAAQIQHVDPSPKAAVRA